MLAKKANRQASTLSGGEQKLLEIARGLLLDPKLIMIDESLIGLSPKMVQEVFVILQDLRAKGVSILMVEQNAKSALEISDDSLVLEMGRTRLTGRAASLLQIRALASYFWAAVLVRRHNFFAHIFFCQMKTLCHRWGLERTEP